ncbi:hypothetical protein C0Q70_10036 [Pomacea canaliculata]|uniref:SAP domain-containing protein n=1 Tax=Pomacea canaliculata TaxID=400727 RepID=A0A2T7PBG9_POMCA|nr:SAP domain-containing ribonucleoprotein-like [Pomacea canaliculata]PVD30761.1 hypothetical protein C0Q70_10036 [Pomacea canaliculata]
MATLNVEDISKMKVADLKKELKERGLTLSGTKAELVERLLASMNTDDDGVATGDSVDASIEKPTEDFQVTSKPVKAVAEPSETPPVTIVDSTEDDKDKKAASVRGMSEAERLKARAEKFGGSLSDAAKKQMRAERFGLDSSSVKSSSTAGSGTVGSTLGSGENVDKMKKRAERFGVVTSEKLSKVEEDEKRKKRLERFGGGTLSAPTDAKTVKLTALADVNIDERKRKRAERFGLT